MGGGFFEMQKNLLKHVWCELGIMMCGLKGEGSLNKIWIPQEVTRCSVVGSHRWKAKGDEGMGAFDKEQATIVAILNMRLA